MPEPDASQKAHQEGRHLALVRAVEQETAYDIRECADQLLLGPAEVNRAVLGALRGARQLDG